MKNISSCFSHNTDDWKTPSKLYDYFVNKLHCIDCFPFHSQYNEFDREYFNQYLFVNPPFSKLKDLPNWIHKQYDNHCTIFLLIPSRTDTKYFHQLLEFKPHIYFIKGRLCFNDSKQAPFPTIILQFNKDLCFQTYSGFINYD